MASPFLEDPVDLGARILRGSLKKARVFRDRQNPLAFTDNPDLLLTPKCFCMMTCDHHCMVTSIEAKWPGSVHDSRIFRESPLCHRFEQGLAARRRGATACVVLHNIASIQKERAPPVSRQPPDVMDPVTPDHPTGRTVREPLIQQCFA
ncbi:uncharacterized protein ACJ7VT_010172 [Polymixia lowei]